MKMMGYMSSSHRKQYFQRDDAKHVGWPCVTARQKELKLRKIAASVKRILGRMEARGDTPAQMAEERLYLRRVELTIEQYAAKRRAVAA